MMKKNTLKLNKLGMAVLALSLTQAASAETGSTYYEADNASTYWGVGIGSVIGAVIAGPPGAALGATLGGSIGWGQDKDQALDQSLLELERNELVLGKTQTELQQNKSTLVKTKQQVSELSRSNAQQSAQLANLMMQAPGSDGTQSNNALQGLIGHYAQDVYFRNGESDVPTYAEARLNSLTDFLKSHPNLNVLLKGYTDQRGAADFNAALAQDRVDGIKEALLEQGVDVNRVTTQAIGETESLELSSDLANNSVDYVLDRRVSIELSISDEAVQPIASIGEVAL